MYSKSGIVAVIMAFILLCSCSVKEDRADCPVVLGLDFSLVNWERLRDAGLAEISLRVQAGDYGVEQRIGPEQGRGVLEMTVPKSCVEVSVVGEDSGLFSFSEGLEIPLGEECPPLFWHRSVIEEMTKDSSVFVYLHKDYAEISFELKIKSDLQWDKALRVRSNVSGYLQDKSLRAGDFIFEPEQTKPACFSVKLPRQSGPEMTLDILENGIAVRSFALGEFLIESGYDWSAPVLEDIVVEVDYTGTEVGFKINQWTKVLSFEIKI